MRVRELPALLVPVALFIVHALLLGPWIVDDAGISFAYARDLAAGHGLVAQPDAAPVEGFTNLAWVLILAAAIKLDAFAPAVTPKVLAACFVAVAFLLTGRLIARASGAGTVLVACALSITAATSGFVIWCASGLENALYAMLLAILAGICAMGAGGAGARRLRSIAAGLTLFLVFCTRPDGALYFWILPFLLGLEHESTRERPRPAAYVWSFAAPWLLLTLFRLLYFGDVLPNSFYAKKGEGAKIFAWLLDHWPLPVAGLAVAALGVLALWGIARGFAALGGLVARRVRPEPITRHLLAWFFVTAIFVHQALPGDWMPEYRFATPAFLFGPAAALAILADLSRKQSRLRAAVVAIALAALAVVAVSGYRRTTSYARRPTIAFADVCDLSARIAAVTERLGPRASVLTPDIGGALWVDRFRVLDLVGLTDRELGRRVRRDGPSIRAHVLGKRKPEAIWLHSFWARSTGFALDPAFAAQYAPVWGGEAPPGGIPEAGFYVRRDLLPRLEDGAAPGRRPE